MSKDDSFPNIKKNMTDDELFSLAARRVKEKNDFWIHLSAYLLVNIALWIYAFMEGHSFWPIWVTFGWGIGIVSHGLSIFMAPNSTSIQKEMDKLKKM